MQNVSFTHLLLLLIHLYSTIHCTGRSIMYPILYNLFCSFSLHIQYICWVRNIIMGPPTTMMIVLCVGRGAMMMMPDGDYGGSMFIRSRAWTGWMDGLGKIGACGKLKSIKSRHKSIINGISRDKREDEEIVVGWTN